MSRSTVDRSSASGYTHVMLIGTDAYQFEVVDSFGHLPVNMRLGYTHGVCVDTEDNVYVFNQGQTAVVLLNRHGEYLRSWGEEFADGAHGLRLTDEQHHQFLYLTDVDRGKVVKTSRRGLFQYQITTPPRRELYASRSDFKPTDVCVAPNSDVYVMDGYGKSVIHVYDRKGIYQKTFGYDELDCPHAGWIDTRKVEPELYVADRGHQRIAVYSLDGQLKRSITDPAISAPSGFYQFYNELWVADLHGKIYVLDPQDKVAAVIGENPGVEKSTGWPNNPASLTPGRFNSPHAICVDRYGDIYVAEWISTGRVTKLLRKSPMPTEAHLKPGRMD